MKRLAVLLLACVAGASAGSAQPDWKSAQRIEVSLSSFAYAPRVIHLRAGHPILLHLMNVSSGDHDFTAPAFFAAATVRTDDRAAIEDGSVDLPARQSRVLALVPAAGCYPLKCTHAFHKMLGMKGMILVD